MLSSVCFLRIYIIAEKEIKMPELKTLFVLVNVVFYYSMALNCAYTCMAPENR